MVETRMSALRPIAVTSLSDEALAKIVWAITDGEFEPGERLSEVELARQLGISRGPLREALGRLEGRLVVRTPRVGVSVIQISREDLIELFTIREALEGMACRLAAENVTDHEIAAISDLLAQHGRDPQVLSRRGYYQRTLDEDLHLQIMRCSRNLRLEQLLMDGLYYQLRLYRFRASTQPGRAQAAYDEHKVIVAALTARDPDKAEAAMRQHIRNARDSMIAALSASGADASLAEAAEAGGKLGRRRRA
jgi:DNA-binding GntR family transcriptional regulator